jgi:hypothetical protein
MAAKKYSNRSDLQNPAKKVARQAAKGQPYGEAGKQLAAQEVVPMAAPPTVARPASPAVAPGSLGAFNRPTERPNEPLTAGASFGPGPTPTSAMRVPRNSDPVLDELRALYTRFPSEELADMLDSYIREGY